MVTAETHDDSGWRWVRHASARLEDAWREQLAFAGPANLVIHQKPGTKLIKMEVYGCSRRTLVALQKDLGGRIEPVESGALLARQQEARRPLLFGRLVVLDGDAPPPPEMAGRSVLRIGAAMAFGTGEHATTAMCLRLLLREVGDRPPGTWSALDAGTGSGLLALAARKLGATTVRAFDTDSRCLRAARRNARLSGVTGVEFFQADVLAGTSGGRHHVVLANLFSGLLMAAAANLAGAVLPGGCLMVSGILRPQEDETLAALEAAGLRVEEVRHRGKWVAARLRQPAASADRRQRSRKASTKVDGTGGSPSPRLPARPAASAKSPAK